MTSPGFVLVHVDSSRSRIERVWTARRIADALDARRRLCTVPSRRRSPPDHEVLLDPECHSHRRAARNRMGLGGTLATSGAHHHRTAGSAGRVRLKDRMIAPS